MKTLTIRLDEEDEARIDEIKTENVVNTTNHAIRVALKQSVEYRKFLSDLASLFTMEWKVDQKKLKKLNERYGFIQTNLFL